MSTHKASTYIRESEATNQYSTVAAHAMEYLHSRSRSLWSFGSLIFIDPLLTSLIARECYKHARELTMNIDSAGVGKSIESGR